MARKSLPTQEIRFDGAVWEHQELADGVMTTTSVGRELFSQDSSLRQTLCDYMSEVALKRTSPDGVRRYIISGANAHVYAVGDTGLVMKERRPEVDTPLLPSMKRMDYLAHVIQMHCPRWINTPLHYGLYQSVDAPGREFMLMQKVDESVTVGDVLDAHGRPRSASLQAAVHRIFDGVSAETRADVSAHFDSMREHLRDSLYLLGHAPHEYLTDIENNPHNAIVEPLGTPIAGSNYRLTLIDQ